MIDELIPEAAHDTEQYVNNAEAIEGYLEGLARDEITECDCDVDDIQRVAYTRREGDAVPGAPGSQRFWVASTSGSREQTLDWRIASGEWALVVMNADASVGITADVSFGALAPSSLDILAWTSLAVGLVALVGGGWLLCLGLRG